MNIKKSFVTIMATFLFISTFFLAISPVNAQTATSNTEEKQDIIITTLESSSNYGRIKVEDLKNGVTEYLSSVLENGEWVHYVETESGERLHKVEDVDGEVEIDGEVVSEIESEAVIPVKQFDYTNSIMATKWVYTSTTKGSIGSSRYNTGVFLAGTVATILKVPAFYAIVGTAIAFLNGETNLKTAWYSKSNYKDAASNYNTCRRANNTTLYRYNNYTGIIKVLGLVSEPLDPCNSGY